MHACNWDGSDSLNTNGIICLMPNRTVIFQNQNTDSKWYVVDKREGLQRKYLKGFKENTPLLWHIIDISLYSSGGVKLTDFVGYIIVT